MQNNKKRDPNRIFARYGDGSEEETPFLKFSADIREKIILPENIRNLFVTILVRTVQLVKNRKPTKKWMKNMEWFLAKDELSLFSCVSICQQLNMDHESLLKKLEKEIKLFEKIKKEIMEEN